MEKVILNLEAKTDKAVAEIEELRKEETKMPYFIEIFVSSSADMNLPSLVLRIGFGHVTTATFM